MREGLVAQLPYWDTHEGYVFLRNGLVGCALEAFYPPLRLMSDAEIARITESVVQVIRQALPTGASLRVYLEAARGKVMLPRRYLEAVERAEGPLGELHRARLRELELMSARGQVRDWRVTYVVLLKPTLARRDGYTPEQLKAVVREVAGFEEMLRAMLAAAGVDAERLDDQAVRDFLFRYFNPGLRERDRMARGTLREQVAVSRVDNRSYDRIQVGEVWAMGSSLVSGPEYTPNGTLDPLLSLPGEFTVVVDVEHLDQLSVSGRLNLSRVRLKQVAEDLGKRADPELMEAGNALEEALRQRARTGEHVVRVAASVIFYERDFSRLAELHQKVYSGLSTLPGVRVARTHGFFYEHWLRAAPFSGQKLAYGWTYLDTNAAALVPLRAPWRGGRDPVAFYVSREGSLVGINPFDRRTAAYNGLVVGGSGSGKTFFTQSYLTSFLLEGGFLAIIDKGDGYVPLMELLGGQIIRLQPGADVAINPFDLPPGEVEPDEAKKQFLMATLRAILEEPANKALEDTLLMAAIERVYLANTYEAVEGGRPVRRLKPFTLRDFRQMLLKLEEAHSLSLGEEERAVARNMAMKLTSWVGDTPLGRLVDRPTTVDLASDLVYFETTGITANPTLLPVGVLLLTDLVWRKVQRDPSKRKLIVFDEVWSLFRSPEAAGFIEELYRRLRRYNAGAISVSQDLQGFREGYAKGIVENTYYFFLMPSPGQEEVVRELLGISERTVAAYRNLEQRKEILFLMRAAGRLEGDVIRYFPSGYELAAFSTDPSDQAVRNALAQELGGVDKAVGVMAGRRLAEEVARG